MTEKFIIKTCPTCGSEKIERVVRDVTRKYQGQTYIIPSLEFYDCANCGEKVYDRETMLKIEAYSPAYRKSRPLVQAKNRKKAIRAIDTRSTSG